MLYDTASDHVLLFVLWYDGFVDVASTWQAAKQATKSLVTGVY